MNEFDAEIISIEEIIDIIKKNYKLLIIIPLITTIIAFIFAFYLIKPKYTAYTKVFIGKDQAQELKENYNNDDVQMYLKLLKTYSEIVRTNKLVSNAINNYKINLSPDEVLSNLLCTPKTDTQILEIKYEHHDKEIAKDVVSAITSEFVATAKNIIPNGTVEAVEDIVVPSSPSKPNKKMNLCIGFLLGFMIAAGIIFLKEFLDSTFKSTEKLKRIIGLPLLGIIPDESLVSQRSKRGNNTKRRSKRKSSRPIMESASNSFVSEAYRTLQTNIKYHSSKTIRTLLVTSAQLQEGKSTVVSNLALGFSEDNSKVLVIDCDLRNPSIHKKYRLENTIGLSDILQKKVLFKNSIQKYNNNLSVITAGNTFDNPSTLLSSDTMAKLLEILKKEYDLIILDSAPVLAVTDAQILSTKVDATLVTVRYALSKIPHVLECKNLLNMVDAQIIGTVFQGLDSNERTYYYNSNKSYT